MLFYCNDGNKWHKIKFCPELHEFSLIIRVNSCNSGQNWVDSYFPHPLFQNLKTKGIKVLHLDSFVFYTPIYSVIRWENGLGGLGGLTRVFFLFFTDFEQTHPKKSVRIRPIRPIRSPIVSQNPQNHRTLFQFKRHRHTAACIHIIECRRRIRNCFIIIEKESQI
jgi:hypothetical protein